MVMEGKKKQKKTFASWANEGIHWLWAPRGKAQKVNESLSELFQPS